MQSDSRAGAALPAVTVTDITEPTAANEGIELLVQEAVQLEAQPLRARRIVVRLDGATALVHTTSNRRVRSVSRANGGLLAYVTFGPHARGTVDGLPVRPELLVAVAPGTEARFVATSGWETVAFLLDPQDVRAHLAARQCAHEFHLPHGVDALQADPDAVRRLFDWGKRLTTLAARQPAIFNDGKRQRRAASVELFEALLPAIDGAESEPTRSDRTRQGHSDVVKIAEAHALAQVDEHLSVSDLCRVAGVSERTLEYAFREVVGMTPVAYLMRVRLHRVRKGLLAGTHATTTVTTEALNWGFWHFGEFSRAYKDCFGELPSDTLRRPPPHHS